ncbi:MAG: ABC transporter permease [Campylobacterales bacterium]|nr:ABC transporter permease [Campylobacterales bacterium]
MIWSMLHEALEAMIANRMRSFLTMLGMMIGVGAVIIMSAIGAGAQEAVKQSIASMGSNLFIVLSGSTTSGGARMGSGATPTLTIGDAEAIAELPSIAEVAPIASGMAQVIYGSNNWSTTIMGSTPNILTVRNWTMESGYSFTDADVRGATRVALIGKTVAENLFGDENPVGKMIRIKQSPYQVVGVLALKGQSLDGRDQDDTIIVPVTTAQHKLFGSQFQGTVRLIMAQAVSADQMNEAENQMTELLRQRHHIRDNKENDFSIRNLAAMAASAADTAKVMSLMLGAIASISLLVGGIGIMNIMLVSVTERTREIGIRVAIGAHERDILLQFLLEALMISIFGSMIGILLGVGGAFIAENFLSMSVIFTSQSILTAFGVAATIGIFFGFYPARKAAKMEPIDALRFQ